MIFGCIDVLENPSDQASGLSPLARKLTRPLLALALLALPALLAAPHAAAQDARKPNIVIIWGDDIGQSNLSAYTNGLMGYRTPNINSIAQEGMIFTDYYGEQSCTAGRSAFITGQSVFRTGLSKVGLPGADLGLAQGRPDHRRTVEGAGLCHRAIRQEPPRRQGRDAADRAWVRRVLRQSLPPQCRGRTGASRLSEGGGSGIPQFPQKFRPARRHPQLRQSDGTQTIEDTGPLTKKRMETIDDDIADARGDFLEKQVKANKPVFLWVNFTHMHFRTHAKPESLGQAGRWHGPLCRHDDRP